ncbi:AraC family transcriptional regulator, partial [Mycobacterium sp. ITM-2017-0098]
MNPHRPAIEVTVSYAGSADVTPRAIQYAFREHLNTTPLEYLRRVRLERAHQELKSADPA